MTYRLIKGVVVKQGHDPRVGCRSAAVVGRLGSGRPMTATVAPCALSPASTPTRPAPKPVPCDGPDHHTERDGILWHSHETAPGSFRLTWTDAGDMRVTVHNTWQPPTADEIAQTRDRETRARQPLPSRPPFHHDGRRLVHRDGSPVTPDEWRD